MTKEMQLSDGKKKVIADALSRLKKILLSLPEIDVDNVSSDPY